MFGIAKNKKIIAFSVGVLFFIALFFTMPDYNIFWDARNHYFKGQAFINFFLYGRKDYVELPITKEYLRYHRDYVSHYSPDPHVSDRLSKDPSFRRSIYQDDVHTYNWLIKSDQIEHPVLSDILASASNIIFYEKLGWLRDDYAYRVYTLLLASVLVAVIFYWSYELFGFFPAIITTLTLVLTPLFWAESHFNLKDVPETVYFSLSIWQFYKGVMGKSKKNILFSSVFAGFALGTKFNIVFIPFIILPWAVFRYAGELPKLRKWYIRSLWILPLYAVIAFSIFFFSWPQLWYDPIKKLEMVFGIYYKVGVAPDYTPTYRTFFNFGTYATTWIFYTTYPLVGILAAIGIFKSLQGIKKNPVLLLILLWLFIPILRASLPFTSIFGGVRHIMEYIPAISMMAGYGAYIILNKYTDKVRYAVFLLMVIGFIPLITTLIKLHPAENAYFNSLIGGLSGAKKAQIPGWGYNDGGIYRKATTWLNGHAQKGSHIGTAFSEPADFYIPELRNDLIADNRYSGYLQKGEYVIALTHDTGLEHTYRMKYLANVLEPVYEFSVDGVPLIKIYKNDNLHLKKELAGLSKKVINAETVTKDNELIWDLGNVYNIELMTMHFVLGKSCNSMSPVNLQISKDGVEWEMQAETYPTSISDDLGNQPENGVLTVPVPALSARYVLLSTEDDASCLPKPTEVTFSVLEK